MDRADILLNQAKEWLEIAEHEKERASEDVVTHLICTNSRKALTNYLAGFIIRRQVPVHHPSSVTSLLDQCKSLDARFENLDLTQMHCRLDKYAKEYCLESEQVDVCIRLAQQARDLVTADTPPY